MAIISKATTQWSGTLKNGHGLMKPEHGASMPFSYASRFEGQQATSPEGVLGSALAGCFSMALAVAIEKAGAVPKSVKTSASVTLDKDGDGFTITTIELVTEVVATGIDATKFQALATATKKSCPVSKALSGVPNITLKATLAAG